MNAECKVWVRNKQSSRLWQCGTVVNLEKYGTNKMKFRISIEDSDSWNDSIIEVDSTSVGNSSEEYEDVKLRNQQEDDGSISEVCDLTDLHNLHEPSILNCLQARYSHGQIYTAIGPIIISINPFRMLPIYDNDHIERYRIAGQRSHLADSTSPLVAPHIYHLADTAYHRMVTGFHSGDSNQAILVSGESGSGKTECTKYIMRYLAHITTPKSSACTGDDSEDMGVEQLVLRANPILESFGNACTVRNDNSSRFGRFVEINFVATQNGLGHRIRGAITRTYLLEKARLVRQAAGERNYHCFYELLAGAPAAEMRRLALSRPEDFHFTNQSDTTRRLHDRVDDAAQYRQVQESMALLGFSDEDRERVRSVLAGILHLGNVHFSTKAGVGDEEDGSQLAAASPGDAPCSPAGHLTHCSTLLGVPEESLLSVLCEKVIRTPEGSLVKRHTPEEADFARDALAKTLYGALFDFLVQRVNAAVGARLYAEGGGGDGTPVYLSPASKQNWRGKKKRAFIGVLDIFGFESLAVNSFEQLCINYTNETLQSHFNAFVFEQEQALYRREGIAWQFIDYPDNREALDLLEDTRTGLFALCDEQSKFPKASDSTLVNKFYEHCSNHCRFLGGPIEKGNGQFLVVHYAGSVLYSTQGFLEKNNDIVRSDMREILGTSSCWLVQKMCSYFRVDEAFSQAPLSSEQARFTSANREATLYGSHKSSTGFITPVRRTSGRSSAFDGPAGNSRRPSRGGNKRIRTLGAEFRMQLGELMEIIGHTSPHYVRCIKPNEASEPDKIDFALVVQQLKCGGVLESVRVTRSGYSVRLPFADFVKRYDRLVSSTAPHLMENSAAIAIKQRAVAVCTELAESILLSHSFKPCLDFHDQINATARAGIQLGQTRVFLRRNAFDFLETQMVLSTRLSVIKLQSAVRRYLAVGRLRRVRRAALVVQSYYRSK